MAAEGKMPPELLAHFKSKTEDKEETQDKNKSDKTKRKEALNKARTRLEESSRRSARDKEDKAS